MKQSTTAAGTATVPLLPAQEAGLKSLFTPGASSQSVSSDVTRALREAILSGTLPPGTWLAEEHIARLLGVSRTPVREALHRIELERLAVKQGASVTVSKLTTDDILALYLVRETLDGLAARQATTRRTQQLLDQLEELNRILEEESLSERPDLARVMSTNLDFHRLITEASSNEYLQWFLTHVEHALRRARGSTFEVSGAIEAVVAEHKLIIAAIEAGDPAAAEEHARRHVQRSRSRRIQLLGEGY